MFTIRDLLWLTALVGVLVAWWIDHRSTKYRVVDNGRDFQIIDNKTGALWEFKDAKNQ